MKLNKWLKLSVIAFLPSLVTSSFSLAQSPSLPPQSGSSVSGDGISKLFPDSDVFTPVSPTTVPVKPSSSSATVMQPPFILTAPPSSVNSKPTLAPSLSIQNTISSGNQNTISSDNARGPLAIPPKSVLPIQSSVPVSGTALQLPANPVAEVLKEPVKSSVDVNLTDAETVEQLERLARQERVLARQSDVVKKRLDVAKTLTELRKFSNVETSIPLTAPVPNLYQAPPVLSNPNSLPLVKTEIKSPNMAVSSIFGIDSNLTATLIVSGYGEIKVRDKSSLPGGYHIEKIGRQGVSIRKTSTEGEGFGKMFLLPFVR